MLLDEHVICVAACVFAYLDVDTGFSLFLLLLMTAQGKLIGSLKLSLPGSLSIMKMCTTHYFPLDSSSRTFSLTYICLLKFKNVYFNFFKRRQGTRLKAYPLVLFRSESLCYVSSV